MKSISSLKKRLPPDIKEAFKRKPYDIHAIRRYLKNRGIAHRVGYSGYDTYTVYWKRRRTPEFLRGRDLLKVVVTNRR